MTTITKFEDEDINREAIAASSIIHQAATEIDDNLKLRSYTYLFNKKKLAEADVLVLRLAAKIKEIASYGNSSN